MKVDVHGSGGTHLLFLADFWGSRHSLRVAQINKHVHFFALPEHRLRELKVDLC